MIVNTSVENVVAFLESSATVSVTEVVPILIANENGNVITVGNDSSVLVESPSVAVLVTGILGPQGVPGISEEDMVYAKRVDFVTDAELYKGESVVGSLDNSPVWRIRKIIIGGDGDVTETWAGGTALFDKVWTNRAGLTYI